MKPSALVLGVVLNSIPHSQAFQAGHFLAREMTTTAAAGGQTFRRSQQRTTTMRPAAADDDDENDEDALPLSGSFFNEVSSAASDSKAGDPAGETDQPPKPFDGGDLDMFQDILKNTKLSTGGGQGFSKTTSTTELTSPSIIQTPGDDKSFVGIGKPLNDIQNPEYDENGYTLYADETTGEKKRVFEALVEYPSLFKIKVVGADNEEETFAPEIVELVAKSCGVDKSMVKNSKRKKGKWTSVTVSAPVQNADMLYALYETIDQNPRVKFKF